MWARCVVDHCPVHELKSFRGQDPSGQREMACKRRRSHWHSFFPWATKWHTAIREGVDDPTPPRQLQSPPDSSHHRCCWVGFRLGNPKRVRHHNALDAPFPRHLSRECCVVFVSRNAKPQAWGAMCCCPQTNIKKPKSRSCFNKKDPVDIPRLPCETAPPKDPA